MKTEKMSIFQMEIITHILKQLCRHFATTWLQSKVNQLYVKLDTDKVQDSFLLPLETVH